MAEALCGPSNPLQTFRKQAGLDRTLQQDRLVQQNGNSESFRSASQHTSSLDAQFEAFRDPSVLNGAPSQIVGQPVFHSQNRIDPQLQHFKQPASSSSWIAEFSRLHLPQSQSASIAQLPPSSQSYHITPRISSEQSQPQLQPQYDFGRNVAIPYQSYNAFPGTQTALWTQPSTLADRQEVTQAIPKFDETAFQAAFDAAESQSREQRPDILAAEAKDQVIPADRGQLALLQYNLFASVLNPTEQNIHRAALFMSLLEQYDPKGIDQGQADSLRMIMRHIAQNPRAVSYFARYDLQERAARYRDERLGKPSTHVPTTITPQMLVLQSYIQCIKAEASQPIHDLDASSTVATDPEMQADLAMQLQRLNEMPAQDRIIQAVSDNAALDIAQSERMQRELETMWHYEKAMLGRMPGALEQLNAQMQAMPPTIRQAFQRPARSYPEAQSVPSDRTTTILQQPEQQQPSQPAPQQHDELAQTAAELLDKVSHDQSDKFQNSTFLELMRKLKNREVQVEGDKMVARTPEAVNTVQTPASGPAPVGSFAPAAQPMAVPARREMMDDAISEQGRSQIVDGQDVIGLLNQPSFQPQDTVLSDPLTGRLYDEQDADLGAGLFDA